MSRLEPKEQDKTNSAMVDCYEIGMYRHACLHFAAVFSSLELYKCEGQSTCLCCKVLTLEEAIANRCFSVGFSLDVLMPEPEDTTSIKS